MCEACAKETLDGLAARFEMADELAITQLNHARWRGLARTASLSAECVPPTSGAAHCFALRLRRA